MKNESKPLEIAIAGVSGGGKTTITNHLNDKLNKSKVLSFDDYDFEGPSDIIDWIDKGAKHNDWNLDPLIKQDRYQILVVGNDNTLFKIEEDNTVSTTKYSFMGCGFLTKFLFVQNTKNTLTLESTPMVF